MVDDDYELLASIQSAHLRSKVEWDLACVVESQVALDVAVGESVAAAVVDLVMPDRDGIEVIRGLRRIDPNLPILAITGLNSREDSALHAAALALGAERVLMKPFSFEELCAAVDDILG